jgi:hypothetical protein
MGVATGSHSQTKWGIFSIWGQKLWNDRSIDRNIGLRWFKRPIKQCCTGYQRLKFRGLGRAWRRVMIFQRVLRTFYCPHFVCNWLQSIISSFEVNQIKRYWLFVKLPMVRGVIWHKIYSNSKSWVLLLEAIRRQSEDIFSIWGQKLWNDRSIDRNIGLRWFKRPIKQCCTGYQRLKFRGLGRAWRRVMIFFQRFWGHFIVLTLSAIGFKALYQVLKLIKLNGTGCLLSSLW